MDIKFVSIIYCVRLLYVLCSLQYCSRMFFFSYCTFLQSSLLALIASAIMPENSISFLRVFRIMFSFDRWYFSSESILTRLASWSTCFWYTARYWTQRQRVILPASFSAWVYDFSSGTGGSLRPTLPPVVFVCFLRMVSRRFLRRWTRFCLTKRGWGLM